MKERKPKTAERITSQGSSKDKRAAIKHAAVILRDNREETPMDKSCRRGFMEQMNTPSVECHEPNMEMSEVDEEFEEGVMK